MKVLVACEESQAVCIAFRNKGHEAYSCDILPCSGGHPEWHIQNDVLRYIKPGLVKDVFFENGDRKFIDFWDMVISFPPCTDLAVSGCRWFDKKRLSGSQEKSIKFFFEIWKRSNCTENPIGIMNGGKYIAKYFPELYNEMINYGFPFRPTQIVHPYMFGDGERKATCLWLNGIPPLLPTQIVPIDYVIGKNGKKYTKTHYGTCFKTNKFEQGKLRSKTFPGIAKQMAEQWG